MTAVTEFEGRERTVVKMRLRDFVYFSKISSTFLITVVIFTLISLAGLGTVLIAKDRAALQRLMESRGKAMADFLDEISVKSFMNNDFSTLEDYVRETLKDPDLVFIAYYDAEKKPLTKTSEEPADVSSLLIQEREIRSPNGSGKVLGFIKLGYSRNALSSNLHSGIVTVVIITLIVLALSTLGAMGFIRGVTQPLLHLTEAIEKAEQGDLTVQVRPERSGEAGILAHSFEKMSNRLKEAIKKIQDASHQVSLITEGSFASANAVSEGAARQAETAAKAYSSFNRMDLSLNHIAENISTLSSTAQENAFSLGEMSAAIREAADGTVALSTSVKDTGVSLSGMSSTIKEVAGYIDTLLLYAEEATASVSAMNASIEEVEKNANASALLAEKGSQEAAELGIGAIEQTMDGMDQIKKTVEKSSHIIHQLDDRAKKIGNILTVIDGVTRQTNLLALNASILAAQAGNEGKGFAVVSNEMKNLADRTEASTTEIAQLIRDVQSDTTDAVDSVKEGLQSVEEGVRRSAHARDSLTKIMEISERSSAMSRQIEKATQEQVKATNQMTQLMEKVSVMVMKINTAMSELENGTFNITEASQKMNSITRQVQTSLEDQVKGSLQINDTGENVRVQIQQIAAAINDQKKESELIIKAILEIQQTAQTSVLAARKINQIMEGLASRTTLLKTEAHQFKIQNT